MSKYETTNSKYYFNDADLNTRALDIDTMQIEFDSIEDCIEAAKKWHERTGHKVSIRQTYTVDVEVIDF